ncbi:MAG: hypothetical protein IT371_03925 [Deltaproteobacteria bacterium]|nr:hypothetical protein [Deltaproteobacteria bacterium]
MNTASRYWAAVGVAVILGAARAVAAEGSPVPERLEVEVRESGQASGRSRHHRLSLALPLGSGGSRLAVQLEGADYALEVERDHRGSQAPVMHVSLNRLDRSGQRPRDLRVRASTPWQRGRRVTLAELIQPDGSRIEVVATVR